MNRCMVSVPHPCYNLSVLAPKTFALEVHQRLLNAYGQPVWRIRLPPVDELISTILSQNTQDVNRDRAFASLREAFPTWEVVRDAKLEAVIDAIKIAGLSNQKGPRIQRVLRQITEERGEINLDFLGQLPPDEARAWLLRFKGVGPKTAAIVMLFSLDIPAFPVDTHIYRVTGRLGLRPEGVNAEKAHELLGDLFPPETYYAVHLNLIRHGRQVCLARTPACGQCVLQDLCTYYREFVTESATLKSDG
ncbi:MAG: endonuclease III domain-containing protein [Candidatus Hodarchaeota archaeon]